MLDILKIKRRKFNLMKKNLVKITSLLIHAAKVDEHYSEKENDNY